MKKFLLLLVLVWAAWDVGWALRGVPPLFPWQLAAEYRPGHPELLLLDVRTPREFAWFHLPGAQNVPFTSQLAAPLDIPREKTVVVICLTGHRSTLVAWRLKQLGHAKVYNLTGGMAGWLLYQWLSGHTFAPPASGPAQEAGLPGGIGAPAAVRGARS